MGYISGMTMNKSETELIENVAKTMANAMAQNQQHQVSRAVDNPLIWVSFLGAALLITGTLLMAFYNDQQGFQNDSITSNKASITELKDSIERVVDSVKDIQHDQKNQTTAMADLLNEIKELKSNNNKILSTRFEDKDFPIHIRPFEQRLNIVEDELADRKKTIKKVEEIQNEQVDIKARIKILEAR